MKLRLLVFPDCGFHKFDGWILVATTIPLEIEFLRSSIMAQISICLVVLVGAREQTREGTHRLGSFHNILGGLVNYEYWLCSSSGCCPSMMSVVSVGVSVGVLVCIDNNDVDDDDPQRITIT